MSSPATKATFNLVDRGWIHCLMTDGSSRCLSLTEVFEELDQIRCLSGDSPQQDYAVFRVLLAIFWRSHAAAEDVQDCEDYLEWWEDLFEGDSAALAEPVFDYLQKYRSRFDLLDGEAPFMQVADLATSKGEHATVQRLIPEAELDYFTMRAGQGAQYLSLGEAARWLISVQAWDYSGIKPGAEGDPRVKPGSGKGYPIGTGWAGFTGGVVLHGSNLTQTFLLNTPASQVFTEEHLERDHPAWEREPATAAPRSSEFPEGPCDVLTWQTRRVKLFPSEEVDKITGVLVTNGDKIEIRNQFTDPMTGYRYSTAQSKKGAPIFFAKSHAEERALWKGVEALLASERLQDIPKGGEPDKPPATLNFLQNLRENHLLEKDQDVRVELVGFIYGPQSSIITNSVHEVVPFKLRTLLNNDPDVSARIIQAARRAVEASINLGQFAGFLAEAAGGSYAFLPAATESALNKLEARYKDWLLTFTPGVSTAQKLNEWCDTVERLIQDEAVTLARGAGNKALIGRLDTGSEKPRVLNTSTAFNRLRASLKKTLERIPIEDTTH